MCVCVCVQITKESSFNLYICLHFNFSICIVSYLYSEAVNTMQIIWL